MPLKYIIGVRRSPVISFFDRRRNLAEQAQVVIEQHPQQEKEAVLDNRILYSKIPSYLLSGRQPLASNRSLSEETSSVSNSSDSEGATSSAYRTR